MAGKPNISVKQYVHGGFAYLFKDESDNIMLEFRNDGTVWMDGANVDESNPIVAKFAEWCKKSGIAE